MSSFKTLLGFLLMLLVATIAVLALVCYRNNEQMANAAAFVKHSHDILTTADELATSYDDARLAINATIIRGDTVPTAEYRSAIRAVSENLFTLRKLTTEDQQQQLNLDLFAVAFSKFKRSSDSITVLVESRASFNFIRNLFIETRPLRNHVKSMLRTIADRQRTELMHRELASQNTAIAFTRTFVILLICMAILVLAMFMVVRYNFNKRRNAEEAMRKALDAEIELNKLKSNFVTLASHEFRTPLTTILSSAFLLENYYDAKHEEKASKHLARIKSSVNNLTLILDEFLSVSKIEEGQVQPALERIDLPKYMSGLCNNLQSFTKPGQVIHYHHVGETSIDTDPVLFGNILSNLVTNSIKYSGENTTIDVITTVNSRIHLKVKDSGIGIPEEDQKHLFERFYRASNAGAVQGTGLGLHIMKHYVQMLNGSIKVDSKLGKGTEVDVVFEHQ